ncbi:MAG: hypothetical protein BRD48_02425 [Bacteroidetes bacterium QS_9_68_14]|nr:MAG: hypothetical protein BRD48_02425 [Bacteroidetes bacterium QS_9_68_14]
MCCFWACWATSSSPPRPRGSSRPCRCPRRRLRRRRPPRPVRTGLLRRRPLRRPQSPPPATTSAAVRMPSVSRKGASRSTRPSPTC